MMKKHLFGLVLGIVVASVFMESATLRAAATADSTPTETVLTIRGMTCGGCVATVKLRLKKVKGVTAYEVSLEKGEAVVTYDPAQTSPEVIAAAVSETGFKATVKPESGKADTPRGQ